MWMDITCDPCCWPPVTKEFLLLTLWHQLECSWLYINSISLSMLLANIQFAFLICESTVYKCTHGFLAEYLIWHILYSHWMLKFVYQNLTNFLFNVTSDIQLYRIKCYIDCPLFISKVSGYSDISHYQPPLKKKSLHNQHLSMKLGPFT